MSARSGVRVNYLQLLRAPNRSGAPTPRRLPLRAHSQVGVESRLFAGRQSGERPAGLDSITARRAGGRLGRRRCAAGASLRWISQSGRRALAADTLGPKVPTRKCKQRRACTLSSAGQPAARRPGRASRSGRLAIDRQPDSRQAGHDKQRIPSGHTSALFPTSRPDAGWPAGRRIAQAAPGESPVGGLAWSRS